MTRFGRVLKLDFTEGLKPMMWGALCMLLLYLFFFWFAWNIGFHSFEPKNQIVDPVCESVGAFSMIAMYIYFLITACTLYRGEQKKQQRIAWDAASIELGKVHLALDLHAGILDCWWIVAILCGRLGSHGVSWDDRLSREGCHILFLQFLPTCP